VWSLAVRQRAIAVRQPRQSEKSVRCAVRSVNTHLTVVAAGALEVDAGTTANVGLWALPAGNAQIVSPHLAHLFYTSSRKHGVALSGVVVLNELKADAGRGHAIDRPGSAVPEVSSMV